MSFLERLGMIFNPVGAFVTRTLSHATGEVIGKQVPEFMRKHVLEGPPRERLMRDIYKNLHEDDSANLRRRIKALGGNHPENMVIAQLCKIYSLTDENHVELLRMLDALSDEDFDGAISLLHHDAAQQFLRYVLDALGLRNGETWRRSKTAVVSTVVGLNAGANALATRLKAYNDRPGLIKRAGAEIARRVRS